MSDDLVTVEARVAPEYAAYLDRWADAIGCDTEDVAGGSIEQFLEDEVSDDE